MSKCTQQKINSTRVQYKMLILTIDLSNMELLYLVLRNWHVESFSSMFIYNESKNEQLSRKP